MDLLFKSEVIKKAERYSPISKESGEVHQFIEQQEVEGMGVMEQQSEKNIIEKANLQITEEILSNKQDSKENLIAPENPQIKICSEGVTEKFNSVSIATEEKNGEPKNKLRLPMIEKLFSLLIPNEELNSVLAGYFSKVFISIMEKQENELLQYIFTFPEHIHNITKHIDNESISGVLTKILSYKENDFSGFHDKDFLYQKMIIVDQLIDQMCPTNPALCVTSSYRIIISLIESKQHLAYFSDEGILKRVFSFILSSNPASLVSGLGYFTYLLKFQNKISQGEEFGVDQRKYFLYNKFLAVESKTEEEEVNYDKLISFSIELLSYLKKFIERPVFAKIV